MKRRRFLGLSAASTALLSGGFGCPVYGSNSPTLVAVVLTDISGETPLAPLLRCAETFISRGIGLTCCLAPPTDQAMEARLAEIGNALTQLGAGVEFALQLPDFSTQSPYFQARAAYDGKVHLLGLLQTNSDAPSFATILCDEAEVLREPTGARAAGFRNVLVQPTLTGKVQSERWLNGVVRFYGGKRLQIGDTFAASLDMATENQQLYYLSAATFSDADANRFDAWLTDFADSMQRQELEGRAALLSVSDLQLRDDYQIRRLVTILLDVRDDASTEDIQNVKAFQDQLQSAGLPSCVKPGGAAFWVEKHKTAAMVPVSVNCETELPSFLSTTTPIRFGYGLAFGDQGVFGLDGCSMLRVPATGLPDVFSKKSLTAQLAGTTDIVLTISADQIRTPMARSNALSSIEALQGDAITVFSDIYDFAEALVPDGFIEKRHRLTVSARASDQLTAAPVLDDAARAQMMADALQAWKYIEKFTNPITGLCPATVDGRSGGDILEAVTMWDVGSNINALVAATEIGIIDQKQLSKAIKLILPNIIGRKTQGRNLPQGWLRTDRVRWGNRNFDGCDAGRLLAALDNLRRRYGMNKELDALVKGWDLEKIIVNQEIHSVIDGELQSTYASHCAHYAALAFRRWGLDASSPYETFTNQSPADGEVMLLEAASKIGAYGAEPLLLEAIELGMSPESAFLADVLFTAQKEEFESTGRLVCVSETPIEKSPWFIYQGLQLGTGIRDWRLNGVDQLTGIATTEAEHDIMAFVTKGAYLWAAYKPGEHSDRLVAYARERAQSDLGFASNVNFKTQRAALEYSDLNTNSIILQSIAHILRPKDKATGRPEPIAP